MSRWERYPDADGKPSRDYTYSRWHRYALPGYCAMIDVDGMDYCRSCAMPLLLVEVARDVGQNIKPTTALTCLAQTANVPAIVVLYGTGSSCTCERHATGNCAHGIEQVRARRIHPESDGAWIAMTGRQLADWIQSVHDAHINAAHRRIGAA